jgi:antitoxin Phd
MNGTSANPRSKADVRARPRISHASRALNGSATHPVADVDPPAGLNYYMTRVVILGRGMRKIQLKDAKAKLSTVVDDAVRGKPSIITRHGKREAVLLSYEEWERLSGVPSFGRLLMSAPLGEDDVPYRSPAPPRDAGL